MRWSASENEQRQWRKALGQWGAGDDGAEGVRQAPAAAVLRGDKPRVPAVQSAQEPLLPREDDEEQSVWEEDKAAVGGGGRGGVSLLQDLLRGVQDKEGAPEVDEPRGG